MMRASCQLVLIMMRQCVYLQAGLQPAAVKKLCSSCRKDFPEFKKQFSRDSCGLLVQLDCLSSGRKAAFPFIAYAVLVLRRWLYCPFIRGSHKEPEQCAGSLFAPFRQDFLQADTLHRQYTWPTRSCNKGKRNSRLTERESILVPVLTKTSFQ